MSKQLEKSVEDYLVGRVEKEFGGMALKGDVKGRRFLDRIVIMPGGQTTYVECKRPSGGVYSAHQDETLERLGKMGHRTARLKTHAEVDAFLAANPAPQAHLEGVDIHRLPVGTTVTKVLGYPFPGTVVAAFHTLSGQERFVVEATGEGYCGMLHIFNGDQLRALAAPASEGGRDE